MSDESQMDDPPLPSAIRTADLSTDNAPTCPMCDYILIGLTSDRCPECGTPVDVEQNRRLSSNVPRAATAWERGGGLREFLATWFEVLLRPTAFVSRFPGRHHANRAIAYGMTCIVSGALLYIVICLLESWGSIAARLSDALGFLVAVNVTNVLVAAWATRTTAPRHSRAPYHFWRGLTHYASGPVVFVGIGAGILRVGNGSGSGIDPVSRNMMLIAGLIIIAFGVTMWLSRLMMMSRRQCRERTRRIAISLHPWVAVWIGAFCGLVTAGLVQGPFTVVSDAIGFILS